MKKTILYIGKFELPSGTASAQRVNVNKKILKELGYKVIFVSTFEKNKNIETSKEDININHISVKTLLYDINFIKEIIKKNGVENIHSVIFYNYPSIALIRAFFYLKRINIKVFADCTEWYNIPKSSTITKIFKFIDTEFRMRLVHKNIDGVICISSYLISYYENTAKKTVLLPNLIDLKDPKWAKSKDFEGNRTQVKFLYAGSPGNFFEKEDLALIVDIFSEMLLNNKEIYLEIIGVSKERFIELYEAKTGIKPKLKNVLFQGRKSHLEVIERVKKSDYFIFLRPNTRANIAGFPTKLVESFGALTPVITNNVGDVGKYIENGVNGYIFKSNDLKKMSLELEDIIKNHHSHNHLQLEIERNNPFNYKNFINNFGDFIK